MRTTVEGWGQLFFFPAITKEAGGALVLSFNFCMYFSLLIECHLAHAGENETYEQIPLKIYALQ